MKYDIVRNLMLFCALSVNFMLFYDFDLEPRNVMFFSNFMLSGWSAMDCFFVRCNNAQ